MSQPRLINLIVLHHPLDIVARLLEGDALDPVHDLVDGLSAWIAIAGEPVRNATRAGIIGDEGENVGTAEAVDLLAEVMGSKRRIIAGVARQTVLRVGEAIAAGDALGCAGKELQEPRAFATEMAAGLKALSWRAMA